jgi:DNA polymerase (family 10)
LSASHGSRQESVSIAGAFKALADLAAIHGQETARDAFTRAAARFESGVPSYLPRESTPLSALGLDPAFLATLGDSVSLSPAAAVARGIADLPRDLRQLLDVPGLSTSDLAGLVISSGATTIGEVGRWLESAECGSADWAPSEALRNQLLAHLAHLRSPAERMTLGRAFDLAARLGSDLMAMSGLFERVEAVGSLRRFDATVGDITLLASASDPVAALAEVRHAGPVTFERFRGRGRVIADCGDLEVTVRIVPPSVFERALFEYTGSRAHLQALHTHAQLTGQAFDPRSWQRDIAAGPTFEEDVYRALGLPFIPPELREAAGEIEAAIEGRLPRLVHRDDIRGDLHVHTLWSDGRDTVETMARRARDLGYQYLAITDHSPASVARGVDAQRLRRQADEIARVQEQVPDLVLLRGVEVDILPDGRLDLGDRTLESLDVVLASLHDSAGQSSSRLTERYLAAIRHPLVHIVTHPANRVVGHHPGYDIDFDRLMAEASESGTALEVDGAPMHLDMEGALARRAVGAGVQISIDSDCHWSERLERQMIFGVATARRGWVEAKDVINTRPLDELRAWLRRKRS